jgi:hypothetical protein
MRRCSPLPFLLPLLLAPLAPAQQQQPAKPPQVGYTDTPLIPGTKWRVHDSTRPHPPVVAPGAATEPAPPPADAIVLFGGKDLAQWTGKGGEARWTVRDGYMEVNGTGAIATREGFGDCQLHIEWATPAEVRGESQGRGNSGVFLMGRYEVQILDSWDNVTYADGQAAALYGQHPPLVNVCRPPGEWQTYDIVFRAPRFADGELVAPARVTVIHNGVVVHDATEMIGPTGHRTVPPYKPHPDQEPLELQDHGNPTRFRNIWIRRL